MPGSKMTGEARDFVQQMLSMYVSDEELGKVGIHREVKRRTSLGSDQRVTTEAQFYRAHREVDATSYGDTHRQTMVVSPGLDATVTGSKEDVDLFALFLIHQGVLVQKESEERSNAEKAKRIAEQYADIKERNAALIAMWAKLGKKRRANLRASDPKVAALCERLEEEREREARREARMDAMENDW